MKTAFQHRRMRWVETLRILAMYPFVLFLLMVFVITVAGCISEQVYDSENIHRIMIVAFNDTCSCYKFILGASLVWIFCVKKLSHRLDIKIFDLHELRPEICSQKQMFRLLELYNTIKAICITAGIKTPKIYIDGNRKINAYTSGTKRSGYNITLTIGAIEKLSSQEMKAIVAHEVGHILNNDVVNQMLVDEAGTFIKNLGTLIMGMGGANDDSGLSALIHFPLYISCQVLGMILIGFSTIISLLFSLAVSRKLEYRADATGCILTKDVNGMIKILSAIYVDYYDNKGMKAHNFTNVAKINTYRKADGLQVEFSIPKISNSIFDTHPSVTNRIDALRNMI